VSLQVINSYYKRDRGKLTKYRHELPQENELSHQNIRDRFYGKNDPVAKSILNKSKGVLASLAPPSDQSIVSE
jgi:pre-mRNA-splicing factor RBM22/SLT11